MSRSENGFFLVLGAGLFQGVLIDEAKAAGYQVIAADGNDTAPCTTKADIFLHCDFSKTNLLLEALHPYANELKYCATVGTDFSLPVAIINEKFQLPGPKIAHAQVTTHKGHMRDFFKSQGFLQPPYYYTTSFDEALAWAYEHPCPDGFVIKPALNRGARGVMYLSEADQLCYAFEFASKYDPNQEIIIEHCIPAQELSVDTLVFQGKAYVTGLADRIIELKDTHYFIETGHTMPSNRHKELQEKVTCLMQNIAEALGTLTHEPFHGALKGDLRLTASNEIFIGEVASRLSGGYMSTHTYPASSSNNLIAGFIELLAGKHPSWLTNGNHSAYHQVCIERAVVAEAGELKNIRLANNATTSNIMAVFQHFNEGDIIEDLQSNVGKLANVIITAPTLQQAEASFSTWRSNSQFTMGALSITRKQLDRICRKRWNNSFCWVCKVCDGEHCASSVPGMGGQGGDNAFRDNSRALAEYMILPHYLDNEPRAPIEPDISFNLFGVKLSGPLMSAPITGSVTNMGGSITEWDYAFESGIACKNTGLIPFFGDGSSELKYKIGLYAIQQLGLGIPVFKPRVSQQAMIQRIQDAEKAGALAWGTDIDGVSFKTFSMKNVLTTRKSLKELKELAACSSLPFFVKGVLTIEDAKIACEAGAAAIIVSNHGGRVLDSAPGTARVLPEVAAYIKKNYKRVTVLADGGIRSGSDIYKMIALGADAVLVGRPIPIAAVGLGRLGIEMVLRDYLEELRQIMRVAGQANLSQINSSLLKKKDEPLPEPKKGILE